MAAAPGFRPEANLHRVEDAQVQHPQEHVLARVDEINDGAQLADSSRRLLLLRYQLLPQTLQPWRRECFPLQAGQYGGKQIEVLEGMLSAEESLLQRLLQAPS